MLSSKIDTLLCPLVMEVAAREQASRLDARPLSNHPKVLMLQVFIRRQRAAWRPWWINAWVAVAALCFSVAAQAPGDVRVALVIASR